MKIGYITHKQLYKVLFTLTFLIFFSWTSNLNAQVVTGADTLNKVSGQWEYFDFTSQKAFTIADTATYTPDFWGSSNEGVNFGKEFSSIIPEKRILLLGSGNIDTVKTVPAWTGEAPWIDTSWDWPNGTQGQPISVGQLWVVYTSEGLYAVMQIDELPDGNFGDSFVFKYKYMSEGGTILEETTLNEGGGIQIAGSTTSTFGTGFDFSREETADNEDAGDYQLDFTFVSNEGVNFGNEGSSSLTSTGRRFLLLGTGSIDTVKSVPARTDAAPWVTVSYDFSDGTGGLPIADGQLWAVYTREGHYAVMEITGLPDGTFGNSFAFDYKYQPNGTRFFDGTDVVEPDPVLSIAIEEGDNQTVLPEAVAPDFLRVLITDENANLISGATVNFSFSEVPSGISVPGSLSASAQSNASGIAQSFVKAGDAPGIYKIKAVLDSDTSKHVIFTLNVEDTSSTSGVQLSGSETVSGFQGFDFSAQVRADNEDGFEYEVDFGFVNNEGVNFGNEGSSSLSSTGRRFLLLGSGDIDTVKSVPERVDSAPWVTVSYDFSDGTGGLPISVGQLWAVYTREGHYAVMEITELPEGNFGNSFSFDYKYQPNGTPFFEGDTSVTPDPELSIIIAGGQNQVTVLGDTIANSLEVIVLDGIGEPVNGITVTFEELSIPDGAEQGAFFTPDGINTNLATTFNNRAYMDYSLGDTQGDYLIKAFLADYPSVDPVTFTITGELVKSPLNFLAVANGAVVDLTWDATEGAAQYSIYRAINDDNPASAALLTTISGTSYTDDNVIGGETYFYQVFGVDVFGNESESGSGPLSATPVEPGDVEMGSATIIREDNQWQYFDFSVGTASFTGQDDNYTADFRGTSNEGVNFGREGAPFIEGNRIILLSGEGLESVVEVPVWTNESPWIGTSWQGEGTSGQPLSVGQLWGVYTSEGHYAAMEITAVPEAFGTSFSFNYKYQPSGSNQFEEVDPLIPSELRIVSGNEQIGNINSALLQPLEVEVLDDEGQKVEGITVHFTTTSVPSGAMGGGLNASSVITNSAGSARVLFTLGDQIGEYQITASVEGLNPVTFIVTAQEVPAPDPVTLLEIRDGFRSNSLAPLWTQSKSDNFLLYRVYMKTGDEEFMLVDSTRTGAMFTQDTSRAIFDLTELQEYTFAVTVVNADLQESVFSNSLTSFPKPTPLQPENVVAVAGDKAVQISWSPVDTTFFDYYYVYYGEDGFGINMADTVYGAENTSTVIGGLENGTTYQFYVFAVNRFGVQSSFPDKTVATPQSTYEEEEVTLPNLINGVSSWADVDNDGDLDLLFTGQEEDEGDPVTLLYVNDGDGNLSDSEESIEGVINSTVYWFDIDKNGFSDLIISGESALGPITKVYLNNEGSFVDAGFTLPGLNDGMVAPADYDSDGDIDFLIAGATTEGPQTILIKNNGADSFEQVTFPFTGFTKAAATWGDANGDGRFDFLISGEVADGSIITMLYHNLGADNFFLAESSFQGVINGTVAFTDFDLDTDQDVLITGYTNTAQTNLFTGFYQNTGLDFDLFFSSNSNPSEKVIATGSVKSRAVVGDYDNDGDPDVLLNANGGASIFNNNRGVIAEEKLEINGAGSVTWADYDGDGDLDIIVTGSSSKVLSNNTAIKNTAPTVPQNLMVEVMTDSVKLSWDASTDAQTPARSLTYNVRIGTSAGASDILSANADLSTGKLRTLANGNAGYSTSLLIQGLPNGTYFWQVQAVDNSFHGSAFATEIQFEVTNSLVSSEVEDALPTEVSLNQNYPNPFNPSTNITYSVPHNSEVTLQVFDITGRLVGTLVKETQSAGSYDISFDARNLSSGVYVYRLQIGNQVRTKKMTLIK